MSTANKLTYLNNTKQLLKQKINNLGGDITDNTTFRQYTDELQNIYDNLPKATGEGTEVSLNTVKGRMQITGKGNTIQDGTPTPDNEVPIKVVTGENTVIVGGKNLFNPDITDLFKLGCSVSESNGEITITATQTGDIYVGNIVGVGNTYVAERGKKIYVKPNTRYTIVSTNGNINKLLFTEFDSNNISLGYAQANTLTTKANTSYIIIQYGLENAVNGTSYKTKIMIAEGTDTTYEPYITPISKQLNLSSKNLFDGIMEVGSFNINGLNNPSTKRLRCKNYIPVIEGQTYTFSVGSYNTSLGTLQISVSFYDKNDYTTARTDYINWSGLPLTFTIPSGTKYIRFLLLIGENTVTINDASNIQLEKGSTATEYTPFWSIEFAKIGTVNDVLFHAVSGNKYYDSLSAEDKALLNVGKWYKHSKIGKVVLDGSENWNTATSVVSGTTRFFYNNNDVLNEGNASYNTILVKSNKFKGIGWGDIYGTDTTTINAVANYNSNDGNVGRIVIRISNEFANTIANFKTWLATNTPIVRYVLATPQYIEITDTTLINQLNAIDNLMSNNGTTIISTSCEDGNANLILSVSALKG